MTSRPCAACLRGAEGRVSAIKLAIRVRCFGHFSAAGVSKGSADGGGGGGAIAGARGLSSAQVIGTVVWMLRSS